MYSIEKADGTRDLQLLEGNYSLALTVTDNDGLISTDTTQVVIETANVAPVADAGADQKIIAEFGLEFGLATLDGSASSDTDGEIVSYLWKEGEVRAIHRKKPSSPRTWRTRKDPFNWGFLKKLSSRRF